MELFAGPAQTAQLLRDTDWSRHALGPPARWPQSLQTIVPIMLASRFAMRVLWGREMIVLYNDAYRPVLGERKHPAAMARPMRESYLEIWEIIEPMFLRVLAGETIALDDQMLPLVRAGYREEAYFTLSYSPMPDDDGATGGVLGVVYETTTRVLAERRLRTPRDLSSVKPTRTAVQACRDVAAALAENPFDAPFALLALADPSGAGGVRPIIAHGIAGDHALAITPLADATHVVAIEPIVAGAYPDPVTQVLVIPLYRPSHARPCAQLILGINPRRAFDATYREFCDLCGEQIASSIANALVEEDRTALELRERAVEDRLRSLFETAPAAIAMLRGPDQVFELANPAYRTLVGRPELVGRAGREVLPELVEQGVWDIFDRVFATGEAFVGRELAVSLARRGDGRLDQGYFNFTAQALREVDGQVIGIVVFAIEITDQVLARRAEADARAEAERSNLAKDEFLAIVSHELRNPLSAILGWTRMLRTAPLGDDKRAQALETIERNAVNQSQLIEDILDVSRIVTGKLKLEVRPIDLVEVVRAAVESARPSIEAKAQRVRMVLDDAAVALMGDAARLQQVVWNLLTNATKFTPKGGSITITLRRVDSALELTVSDTGKGISAALVPHVFERFKQADSSTTRQHGGLGLGLAITKSIIEMHGGTVSARSDGEGAGASFSVRLPIAPVRPASPTQPPARAAQGWECPAELTGLHVLVVDDDADGRNMIAFVLEQCGSRVTRAASVAEAMVAFGTERPQVILSDIGMPDEDGYSFIRRIRALAPQQGGSTPAASLTAYAGVEDRRRALNAGFNMHVPKPIDPAELVAVIGSLARFARALR
jgi:PAS domain S-box-containing protein